MTNRHGQGATSEGNASPEFRLRIVTAPDEIDQLNHVSNVVYLNWVLRVATAHSDAVGFTWPAYQELGSVFMVSRHEIDYLRPAVADDEIDLVTWIEDWKGASCIRCTSIRRVRDDRELARARTKWVMVSLDRNRPTRIPAQVKEGFSQLPTM